MFVRSDLHIHTTLSRCCCDNRQTLENIIPLLVMRGFKRIGISNHFWLNPAVPPNSFYSTQDGSGILGMREQLYELDLPVEVLLGGEGDMVAPGVFGIPASFREKLDYVMLATDHFHLHDFVAQPKVRTPRGIAVHMLEFFRSAAASRVADILVHPMLPLGFLEYYDRAMETVSQQELLDAFRIAAENDVAIELNAAVLFPVYPRLYNLDTAIRVYTAARDAGCKFTFGSDSHALASFDALPKLGTLADRLGLLRENFSDLALV